MTLTTGAASGAPILAPEQVGELLIRPALNASIAAQAATVVSTSSTSYRVPVITDDPSAAWVAEGAEISPSDAVFAEEVVIPSKLAGLSIVSRELADDSSPAAAEAVGFLARSRPSLASTSVCAFATPRPSHRVKVTLEPALPPLGWNTSRIRPGVLRRWTLPPSWPS